MKRYWERLQENYVQAVLALLVLAVFLCHAAEFFRVGFVEQMENIAYDTRMLVTLPRSKDDRIVIVDIDERSITAEGRFPWNRQKMSLLVEQLFDRYKAGLVAFDIFFPEPDESSGLTALESLAAAELRSNSEFQSQLGRLRQRLDYDGLFSQTLAKYPVVLAYYFNFNDRNAARIGELPEPTFVKGFFKGRNVPFLVADGYGANLPAFQEFVVGAGHVTPWTDSDGVVRRVPMLIEYDGAHYAALSLEVVRLVSNAEKIEPRFEKPAFARRSYSGFEMLQLGNRLIPIDRQVQALVPYRGVQGSFPYVSATDILQGRADPGILENRIVLVGTSAPGLFDLRATPVQEAYPGVEVHANLISGMLDGKVKASPEYALGAEVVLLLIFGLAMALGGPSMSPLGQTGLTVGLLFLFIALNMFFWSVVNLVLPLASGVMMLLMMFLMNMSWGYFIETRGKRQLTGLFGHYVPPQLVEEMSKHPDQYSLEADSRELSVLFCDVRGFTTLSEGLSPKELSELMNQFLTPMTEVIHNHRGTIDKYMGDAIMAFWGAPIEDRNHARHALEAALEMQLRTIAINKKFRERGWPEIRIGAGINTGIMSVGNMGSEFRMAYTVLGDAVNLGSRLEGLTKSYGVDIIVGENTAEAVADYAFRELDRVRVKGKDKPVAILEPLGRESDLDSVWKDELKLYRQALRYYRNQEWDMAELQFLNLSKSSRSPALYRMYSERVAYFRKNPPPTDWDGVFTHTTK